MYTLYVTSIEILITHGIDHFTMAHAKVLCAWVLSELYQVSASEIDAFFCASEEKKSILTHQKILLKQTLYSSKDSLPPTFKSMLVKSVIVGIGKHVIMDKMRMSSPDSTLDKDVARDSWINCIRALVNIAESCLGRLPLLDTSNTICAHLVRAFVESFAPSETLEPTEDTKTDPPGSACNRPWRCNLLNPNRYADTVLKASDECYDLENRTSGILTPPTDVQDVVRALFLRYDVNIPVSKYGYGDWLSICQIPVTPYDLLLYDHQCNVGEGASYLDEVSRCLF